MKTSEIQKSKNILDSIKLGTHLVAKPEHGTTISGIVITLNAEGSSNKYVIQSNTHVEGVDSMLHTIRRGDIHTVDGKLNYESLYNNITSSHPDLEFVVDFANEEQLKGELPEVEIHRQAMKHFVSAAGGTYRKLVMSHTKTIDAAIRELKQLGEYNLIATMGHILYASSIYPAEYLATKTTLNIKESYEYKMALHNKMQLALLECGRSELRQYLNAEGIEKFLSDFKDE